MPVILGSLMLQLEGNPGYEDITVLQSLAETIRVFTFVNSPESPSLPTMGWASTLNGRIVGFNSNDGKA